MPVCPVTQWGEWSHCTATCGVGRRLRTRQKAKVTKATMTSLIDCTSTHMQESMRCYTGTCNLQITERKFSLLIFEFTNIFIIHFEKRWNFVEYDGRERQGDVVATTLSHDLSSTHSLVTSLRHWIGRYTMIISTWWLRTSTKFNEQKFKEIHKKTIYLKKYSTRGFVKALILIAIKRVQIIQQLASDIAFGVIITTRLILQ